MTCKSNERCALNTKLTKSVIEDQNIVVLKADLTKEDPEISGMLTEFGNTGDGIPYYAVFRPEQDEPKHFNGIFLGATSFLEKAGLIGGTETAVKSDAKPESDKPAVVEKMPAPAPADAKEVVEGFEPIVQLPPLPAS